MDMHVQCVLRKDGKIQHSWIPKKFAVPGRLVGLKNANKEWEEGWEVIETYTEMPSSTVEERKDDYRNTRKTSDI